MALAAWLLSSGFAHASTSQPPTLESLQTQIDAIKAKLLKPDKDGWDKLTAISGLISGIAVAGIGFYATNVYNRRQTAAESARKDREIQFAEIQTVEKFIDHLASTDEQRRKAALIAISALGNSKVAIDLAEAFKGPGSTSALTTIAATAPPEQAQRAVLALQDILSDLSARVVAIEHSGGGRGNGLLLNADGLVVTARHLLEPDGSTPIYVRLPSGSSVSAQVVKEDNVRDLVLLQTQKQAVPPLDRTPSDAAFGERVVVVWIDPGPRLKGGRKLEVGRLLEATSLQTGEAPFRGVVVQVNAAPGMSGAPAVDSAGRLLGLVQASDQNGQTKLIPASDVFAFAAET
ncbi:hypothetical protein ASD38_06330 [Caulobacter sp. Root487D2Y]|nr:hypothetical protein ASD38_06330 [Caulobacter sp. Root487D2Y]